MNVLVTGGSRGIGASCVRAFADRGDRVVFFYRSASAETVQALQSETGAIGIRVDVSDPEQVRLGVSEAVSLLDGRIDALVNNAGIAQIKLFTDLTDADWRLIESESHPIGQAKEISIAHLLTDEHGHPRINHSCHGRLVHIEGLVVDQPRIGGFQNILTLKDGDLTISIELTSAKDALKETSVGCRISVTGICIVETETWRPTAGFPHATGIVIVPRTAEDIEVLSRPPWWTPQRFLILILILSILLITIIGWNRFLQTLVKRKSHQLLREQLAKERVALRVSERTNLAVELHDALSQNLTGLAFQLATAKSALDADPTSLPRHLDTTERMLVSSRTEL